MDSASLLDQIARGAVVAVIPNPRRPEQPEHLQGKRWYSMQEVADMLGFGLSKVKDLVIRREIRSVKDGKYRRILPEWVDEYVSRRVEESDPVTARRLRPNGEGSISPYRNGFAAYVWVDKPDGKRGRKWIYGPTREDVHAKWIKLHGRATAGPVATKIPTVAEYVAYWLREVVKPNLAPGSYVTYEVLARKYIVPGLGRRKLDRLKVSDVQTWLNGVRLACQCCVQGKDAGRPPAQQRCCAVGACCREVASAASVVHLGPVLRTILNQAIVDGCGPLATSPSM